MPSGVYSRHRHRNPPRTKSGLKGVQYFPLSSRGRPLSRPWKAYAYNPRNGLFLSLGYYATKEEAGRRYNEWALKTYGPDAYLNPV